MKRILRPFLRQFARPARLAVGSLLLAGLAASAWAGDPTVFATGLNNPRGLKFGPDGNLYVAEGGTGGLNASEDGPQVAPPVGPYTGNATGARISRIDANGLRTTVIDNLPSSQSSAATGANVSGVGDIAFLGDTMYALLTGAGASHGVPSVPNGIIRVNANGTYDLIANLSAYYAAHPVQQPSTTDFEPDGVPYSMIAYRGDLYVLEPNRGSLDKVTSGGKITRVLDTSAIFGTVYVPTVMLEHQGDFYIGNLNSFLPGGGNVLKLSSARQVIDVRKQLSVLYRGFTDVLGIAMDAKERLYVLEASTGSGQGPAPMTGDLIRVSTKGQLKIVASGLFFPTGVTIGPDGALYVSNVGFGPAPNGLGQILRITP